MNFMEKVNKDYIVVVAKQSNNVLEFKKEKISNDYESLLHYNDLHGGNGCSCLHRPVFLQGRLRLPVDIALGAKDQQQGRMGSHGGSRILFHALLHLEICLFRSGYRQFKGCIIPDGRILPSSLFPEIFHIPSENER